MKYTSQCDLGRGVQELCVGAERFQGPLSCLIEDCSNEVFIEVECSLVDELHEV